MPAGAIQDTDILGLALSEGTMLVNFAPSFENVGAGMDETQERLLVYAMVNTLCAGTKADSVCFFRGGAQFDGFSGKIYWRRDCSIRCRRTAEQTAGNQSVPRRSLFPPTW